MIVGANFCVLVVCQIQGLKGALTF